MKNSKRILSVKVKRMFDESPDTSTLGEYSNRPETEFAIDRAHSEDCAAIEANHIQTVNALERIIGHLDKIRTSPEVADNPDNTEWEGLDAAQDLLIELQSEAMECDCGGHNVSSREYRYFNPATVEPFKPDAEWIPASITDASERKAYWHEAMRKNARLDYERMEGINNQNWYYMGISAEAEIAIPVQHNKGCVPGHESYYSMTQHITSGGLWGVESDSDASYIKEIEQEQLSELKTQLLALGFSKRAISTAFKTVQEVSE